MTVEDLQRQLNEALARVDHLSADLAKEHSLYDVQSWPHLPHHLASPMPSVQPSQFTKGGEIMADTIRPPQLSAQSRSSDHLRYYRSESCSSTGSHRSQTPGAFAGAAPSMTRFVRTKEINSGAFDMTIKPRNPPTFSRRTQDDAEMWVGQVSNFFCLVGGPPQKQVAFASMLLQGTAQSWWQRKVKTREDPKDWESLADQLIGRFTEYQ